jgi:hypothetical protein
MSTASWPRVASGLKTVAVSLALCLLTTSSISACTAVDQRLTYPNSITIAASSLEHFRTLKPDATYGVVVILAYRDGRLTFKTAGHADFDDAFRNSLAAFGHSTVVTPIDASCGDTIAGAWLMVFTLPDGRVILLPIPMPTDSAPIPLPATRVGLLPT